jgi:ABC-type bacteriocin/lantibiotic exporter with double-glycine peptidase domain
MRVIKQEHDTDCGIFCCAMLSNCQPSDAMKKLITLKKWPAAKRKNLRTSATDLSNLLEKLGVASRKARFKSWNLITKPAIVGVDEGSGNKYHWIVAVPWGNKMMIADPEYGEVYHLENYLDEYHPRKNKDIVICDIVINEFTIKP